MSKNYKNNSKWVVHATDFEADLFTQGFVSEQTILVAVTIFLTIYCKATASQSFIKAKKYKKYKVTKEKQD